MGRYAEGTTVSADRSKAEIERILTRYGADQFVYGIDLKRAVAQVGFRYAERQYKITIGLPDPDDFRETPTGRLRDQQAMFRSWQQATRQRWRALALLIKATLEAIESGIISFDEAFISFALLPNGNTFGQWAQPQIGEINKTGGMPQLLPGIIE